jgi:hypothetical protein
VLLRRRREHRGGGALYITAGAGPGPLQAAAVRGE